MRPLLRGSGVRWSSAFALALCASCANQPARCPDSRPHDDSFYLLPYAAGRTCLCGQGAFGVLGLNIASHARQYALDFVMPQGTAVVAARGGVVSEVRESCPDVSCPFAPETCCGNFVRIRHDDGSVASYWHLRPGGACVEVGQRVERGDVIARSGNTGQSLLPHLHFEVGAPPGQPGTGRFGVSEDGSMEVPFADVAGDGVPTFFGLYRSGNAVAADRCE